MKTKNELRILNSLFLDLTDLLHNPSGEERHQCNFPPPDASLVAPIKHLNVICCSYDNINQAT